MVMKKFLIALLICIFCSGCVFDHSEHDTSTIDTAYNSEKTDEIKMYSEVKNNTSAYDLSYNMEKNCLELLDLRSRNIINTISYKENETIVETSEYKDGYAVIKKCQTSESDIQQSGGVTITQEDEENSILEYTLELYDSQLNIVNTIPLLDYLEKDKVNVAFRDPIINEDASKIAFLLYDSIYCIDLEQKNTKFIKSVFDKDIEPSQITFIGKNKIGFMGVQGISQTDTCYGYIDTKTDSIEYQTEKNYNGFSLLTSGKYLFMNDGEDPITHSSSGKIIIFDCDSNKSTKMELDGLESTLAYITEDGTKLIAVNTLEENKFRIRTYDITSGDTISEKICENDTPIKPLEVKKLQDNAYGVIYADDEGVTIEDASDNK